MKNEGFLLKTEIKRKDEKFYKKISNLKTYHDKILNMMK